ncbi:hypothetical protein NDU88_001110 [Pleurodeles waltl]|uniref:Uncharacterized protein n=1 Tax=Pleurodeles waltl TaxID=8319 RepID=A0AAV7TGP4_PLEWA|nr:hypothetical protein NDU88_001110 [Pleurodeles waltl]
MEPARTLQRLVLMLPLLHQNTAVVLQWESCRQDNTGRRGAERGSIGIGESEGGGRGDEPNRIGARRRTSRSRRYRGEITRPEDLEGWRAVLPRPGSKVQRSRRRRRRQRCNPGSRVLQPTMLLEKRGKLRSPKRRRKTRKRVRTGDQGSRNQERWKDKRKKLAITHPLYQTIKPHLPT